MLRRMSDGVESIYNDVWWSWWGGHDEIPPTKGLINFFVFDEGVTLPFAEALSHIRTATEYWSRERPDEREEAQRVLRDIKDLFSI